MEKYIMLSINDEKTRKMSEILGNATCKKILSFLAEKDATQTEISKELKIPLNTVDYNVKKLVQSGLIEEKSFFWSIKGKKMPVYRVSNKRIVISPKSGTRTFGNILSVILITGIAALILKFSLFTNNVDTAEKSLDSGLLLSAPVAEGVNEASKAVSSGFVSYLQSTPPWIWFLWGAWFASVIFIINSIVERRK